MAVFLSEDIRQIGFITSSSTVGHSDGVSTGSIGSLHQLITALAFHTVSYNSQKLLPCVQNPYKFISFLGPYIFTLTCYTLLISPTDVKKTFFMFLFYFF